jgi:hypothetical protein
MTQRTDEIATPVVQGEVEALTKSAGSLMVVRMKALAAEAVQVKAEEKKGSAGILVEVTSVLVVCRMVCK